MENPMKQKVNDLFFPNFEKRKQNQEAAFDSRYKPNRFVGFSIASFFGYEALLHTAAVGASVPFWPTVGATLVGLPITFYPWIYLSRSLRELMSQQSTAIRMPVMFLFHASMAILSAFIGLTIVASCTSLVGINPFVLPCFIAVAVAGAIVLSATIAVAFRTQYIVHEDEPTSKNLIGTIWNAAKFLSKEERPFHTKDYTIENKLVVVPFGQTSDEMDDMVGCGYEARSISKSFSSLFHPREVEAFEVKARSNSGSVNLSRHDDDSDDGLGLGR